MLGVITREVPGQFRFRLVQLVKETPGQGQAQDLGLAAAGGHFHHEPPPGLVEHAAGDQPAGIEAHQVVLVLDAHHVVQVDDRLQGLALGEVSIETRPCPSPSPPAASPGARARYVGSRCGVLNHQFKRALLVSAAPDVSPVAELLHLAAQCGHQRRHELFHAAFPQGLVGGKPANARIEDRVRRFGKVWMQGHYLSFPSSRLTLGLSVSSFI